MTRTTTAPAPAMPPPAATAPHTLTEDAVAVFTGVLLISVGVAFYSSAGLLTGVLPLTRPWRGSCRARK